jgi:hypothetical protein
MKTLLLFALLLVAILASSNLVTLSLDCPEQYFLDVSSICIRPEFIESCLTYKT